MLNSRRTSWSVLDYNSRIRFILRVYSDATNSLDRFNRHFSASSGYKSYRRSLNKAAGQLTRRSAWSQESGCGAQWAL